MVHIYVLILFWGTIISILIPYGYIRYAGVACILFVPFFVFKILFHIKRVFLFICIFFITLILLSFSIQKKIENQDQIYKDGFIYKDKTFIVLETVVNDFPNYTYKNNQYNLLITDTQTHVLLFTQFHQKFNYNQTLLITGSITDIRKQDPKWYPYYKKLGVQYVIFNPQIEEISSDKRKTFYIFIKEKLFYFKNYIRSISIERFSSYTNALVLGMLLGAKEELSTDEKDMFNNVGLSHILVVSGYNISLLISFIFILLKSVHKYIRIFCAIIFIILFVVLVGAEGSVVRAALMGSIIIFAKITKRHSNTINVLLLAVIAILLYDPYSIFDAGLHLSFIATYALLKLPLYKKIPEFILSTVWVFLFVLPYIIFLSEYISFGSIISNLLVIWALPLFMLLAFVSLLLGSCSIFIGIDVFLLDIISRYIFIISYIIQYIPRIQSNTTPSILMVLYGIFLNVSIFMKNRYTTVEFIKKHYQKFVPQKPS